MPLTVPPAPSQTFAGNRSERDLHERVLRLEGELDFSNVADLARVLSSALAVADADLVIDLSQVAFMDSAIIRVLSRANELLNRTGHRLQLRSPSPGVRRTLLILDAGGLVASGDVGLRLDRSAARRAAGDMSARLSPCKCCLR